MRLNQLCRLQWTCNSVRLYGMQCRWPPGTVYICPRLIFKHATYAFVILNQCKESWTPVPRMYRLNAPQIQYNNSHYMYKSTKALRWNADKYCYCEYRTCVYFRYHHSGQGNCAPYISILADSFIGLLVVQYYPIRKKIIEWNRLNGQSSYGRALQFIIFYPHIFFSWLIEMSSRYKRYQTFVFQNDSTRKLK